jgi:hypothetical protein
LRYVTGRMSSRIFIFNLSVRIKYFIRSDQSRSIFEGFASQPSLDSLRVRE